MPGEQIHVPATWLTTNNVTVREARVLVHLWAKYRYVVFKSCQRQISLEPLVDDY